MSTSLASLGIDQEMAVVEVDFDAKVSELLQLGKGAMPFAFVHQNINGRVSVPVKGRRRVKMQLLMIDGKDKDTDFETGLKIFGARGMMPCIHELVAFSDAFKEVTKQFRIAALDARYWIDLTKGRGPRRTTVGTEPAFPFIYANCGGARRCLDLRSTRRQLNADWAYLVIIERV